MSDPAEFVNRFLAADDSARQASEELAALGEASLPVIQALSTHAQPDVRWWAVHTCAITPEGLDVTPFLIQGLQDSDPAVRQCAALGLHQRPDEQAVPALIAALADDDSLVARLAANALAAIGSAAVPELIKLVEEDSPSKVRLEAMRALALSKDTRSIPVLFNALESDSMLMEYWANEGLERLGVGMTFFKP